MKKRSSMRIVIVLIIVSIIGFVGFDVIRGVLFELMIYKASKDIPSIIELELKDRDLVKNVECSMSSEISYNRNSYLEWNEQIIVTLLVEDSFDDLNENDQYTYIESIKNRTGDVYKAILSEKYPRYQYYWYSNHRLEEMYGKYVSVRNGMKVYANTSANNYESSIRNVYRKNDRDVFLKEFSWDDVLPDVFSGGDGCAISYCRHAKSPDSAYCYSHSCSVNGCTQKKEITAVCCDIHSCVKPGCGASRYRDSEYCGMHQNQR